MKRALSLAKLGMRKTSPNPLVGCVIVKDNQIIGEGWHHEFGYPHAEIEAINDAHSHGHNLNGAKLYVTLEPCSHWGKTPPCANRLVDEKISEVYIAMRDPNPKVDGSGIKILENAGIKVELLKEFEDEAKFLNRGFIFVHKYNRPFITIKAAMSLDGKMYLNNHSSKWITGIEARTQAHIIRSENDAVLVGANTIIHDDPELTVRNTAGINPLRIILDSKLCTPVNAKVIGNDGKCIILTEKITKNIPNANIHEISCINGKIDLNEAMKYLAEIGVLNLMVEGGGEIISEFMREKLADYVKFFIAPRILGEGGGININAGFETVNDAFRLDKINAQKLGEDILLEGRLTCSPDL